MTIEPFKSALLSGCGAVHHPWTRDLEELAINTQATNGCAFSGTWDGNWLDAEITVRPDGPADIVLDVTPYPMPPVTNTVRENGVAIEDGGRLIKLHARGEGKFYLQLAEDGLAITAWGGRYHMRKTRTYPCPLED